MLAFFNTHLPNCRENQEERRHYMPFKTIETQEALDEIIQSRLSREREKTTAIETELNEFKEKYEQLSTEYGSLKSLMEEQNQTSAGFEKTISELQAKVTGYEQSALKTKIALQHGLPFDLAERLYGETEDVLKEDAERLAALMKPSQPTAPLKVTEPNINDDKAGFRQMVRELTK